MNIKKFAQKNRLNIRKDECGELIIPGRRGQLFDYGDGLAGVIVSSTPKKWGNARRAFEAEGFVIRQNGDFEGSATFDPSNRDQIKLAIRYAGVKRRRVMSEKQMATARKGLEIARRKASGRQDSIEAI